MNGEMNRVIKKTKEYYFIVRGEGEIELNDDVIKVKEVRNIHR